MNSLAHVCALVAVLWLSIYAFQVLSNSYLGFVGLGLFFLVVSATVKAVQDDLNGVQTQPGQRRRRRKKRRWRLD